MSNGVRGWVTLSKAEVGLKNLLELRRELTIYPQKTSELKDGNPEPIMMYKENETAFAMPRGYYLLKYLEKGWPVPSSLKMLVSDGMPMSTDVTRWKAEGPFAEQETAVSEVIRRLQLYDFGGTILQGGCGFGKTASAIEIARRLGKTTAILVHKEFFLRQWEASILKFMPEAKVGIVQQGKCDYQGKDFVVMLMQSLTRDTGEKYPAEMYRSFGLVISDETHRIGAATWAGLITRFNARYYLGLTATPRRKDGADGVFWHHLGSIAYKAKSDSRVPFVKVLRTNFQLRPIQRGRRRYEVSELTPVHVSQQLRADIGRNEIILEQAIAAVEANRKVMVVSDTLEHLGDLSSRFEVLWRAKHNKDSRGTLFDFYTGEWYDVNRKKGKKKREQDELDVAAKAQLIFATKQMIEEGLDIQSLDTMLIACAMSDVEQAVGRIRRWCKPEPKKCASLCSWRAGTCQEKPMPVVVEFADVEENGLMKKFHRRMVFYRQIKAKIKEV